MSNYENVHLVASNKIYTPRLISSMFPESEKIFVLDFKLQMEDDEAELIYFEGDTEDFLGYPIDSEKLFIGRKYTIGNQVIFNIDHHYDDKFITSELSTTHQVILASRAMDIKADAECSVVINHPDTDSILSAMIMSNSKIDEETLKYFAGAATAADHTGERHDLVDLVGSHYPAHDLILSIKVVEEFLNNDRDILKMDSETQNRANIEKHRRDKAEMIVKSKSYDDIGGGVILLEMEEYLPTIFFTTALMECVPESKFLIIGVPSKEHEGKWKISMRVLNGFEKQISSQQISRKLDLKRYGFGGRARGGSTGRALAVSEAITPRGFAELVSNYLVARQ